MAYSEMNEIYFYDSTGDTLCLQIDVDGLSVYNQTGYKIFNAASTGSVTIKDTNNNTLLTVDANGVKLVSSKVGFYNKTPITKPIVSGAKASNVALGSLVTALTNLGLIENQTTT